MRALRPMMLRIVSVLFPRIVLRFEKKIQNIARKASSGEVAKHRTESVKNKNRVTLYVVRKIKIFCSPKNKIRSKTRAIFHKNAD